MKISYNWLQKYFSQPLPSPEKLEELFIFHACEIEGVESAKNSDGEIIDTVLDLKVLPDRAHYALCHKGIAGEVFSMIGIPYKSKESSNIVVATDEKPTIKIDAASFCRRYVGRYVEISDSGQSSAEMIAQLNAIGQRSIGPIVDATNYVMFDIGQPLHAFDADKVKGKIVVRAAKLGEKIELLDSSEGVGRNIDLAEGDYVIADDEGPIAIAGVKGGKRAAITAETKHLILESANFDPTIVRKTSTKYDLRSESSKRYENEITPELAMEGMKELTELISEAIPDAKFGPIVDVYPIKAVQTVIEMDPGYISERLGVDIPSETSEKILESMGVLVTDVKQMWQLTIPFNRFDLTISDDIVEEVGRINGYDKVIGILPPKVDGVVKVLPAYYLSEKIKNILVSRGFSEVSLYTLVAKGEVETAKPLARDKAFARMNLNDGMLSCVERNVLNADLIGLPSIKIFEIGHVFSNTGESIHLSIGAAQVKKVKGVNGKKLIMEVIEIIGKEIGVDVAALNSMLTIVEKGQLAVCELDLGELLKVYKLPANASYTDLDFGPTSANIYKKISPYPFIVRDIAVFVPEAVTAEQVWAEIESAMKTLTIGAADTKAGEGNALQLLVRHSLFDTFKKDGKTSYAYRMVFQSMERTLTDDEVAKIMLSINSVLKGKGWEVR
ncbi:MAG: phenylalanine--tRNA ligase subunit beta [Candidatus Taylorbacteria bacterium]